MNVTRFRVARVVAYVMPIDEMLQQTRSMVIMLKPYAESATKT